jgi:hypothetical protein
MVRNVMRTELSAAWLTFIVVLSVYGFTSAPGLGLVDSGELTTAAWCLGIAHPTGYPFYTLLGHLWLMIAPFSIERGMVVFSVICGSAACAVLAAIVWRLLLHVTEFSDRLRVAISVVVVLGFALSPTAWTSVSFAEVYPLTWLLSSLIVYLAVRVDHASRSDEWAIRASLLSTFLWGLGFGNHLTILWFVPVAIFIVARSMRQAASPGTFLLLSTGLFFLGTSINLYLPIRSTLHPLLNWSDPETMGGLIRHLTAWQYRVWMFKGNIAALIGKAFSYFGTIPGDIGWGHAALALLGAITVIIRRNWLIASFGLTWLIGVFYNLNYEIPDISTYFLVFYSALLPVAVFGFIWLARRLANRVTPRFRIASLVLLAFLPAVFAVVAAGAEGLQDSNRFAVNYTREVVATLPPNAIVMQADWDIQSPFIYLRSVENFRRDVVMLDLNLMQRPWYIDQERRAHPEVFAGSDRETADFIRAVAPFEDGQSYDGTRIEAAYVALHNSIIDHQQGKRPVFVRDTREIGHPGVAAKLTQVPAGFFNQITDSTNTGTYLRPDSILKDMKSLDDRQRYLIREATQSTLERVEFSRRSGDRESVVSGLDVAEKFQCDDPRVQNYIRETRAALQAEHSIP